MSQDRRTPYARRFAACLRLESLEVRSNPSSTITVDDDGAQTNNKADFSSIQAAVNAASPGDRIRVYAGTYSEQVLIPATKDNLSLTAVGSHGHGHGHGKGNSDGNVIIAPTSFADATEAIIRVAGADNVTISGFTITGAKAPAGTTKGANYGVLVSDGGSATVSDNHITAIRDQTLSGEQEGIGVQFGLTDSKGTVLSAGSGRAEDNLIDDYQKGGVVVIGAGSNARVEDNVITGVGPTAVLAQNGVQVSNSATARVEDNVISRNNFTGGSFFSEGILIFQTTGVTVRDNLLFFNNEGLVLFKADGNTVDRNVARNNTANGIGLFQADNNTVTRNLVSNNGLDGINLTEAQNNRIEHNRAFFNMRYGIALEATAIGNTVRNNFLGNNQLGNIFVGNPNNTILNNHIGKGHHGHPFDNV